ncbi:hypothetical protein [Natronocalculus amylovorans]|uniref:SipW-cognate class signal peptide n=1 Tax=Natronocalculus amylovorans TaxID=2917812 RepID=A0AAE3FYU8_9EURY|nr:hypothetical protein [Natronocalculus amylovorans]MCL9817816.1 hypothetical protein [Natronocalculus amylovorans]
MSKNPKKLLSRRELLGSTLVVGSIGALSGASTQAYLQSNTTVSGHMTVGGVTIETSCEDTDDDSCTAGPDGVELSLSGFSPGEMVSESFSVTATDNPLWLWVRACPPETSSLAGVLEATLEVDRACDGDGSIVETGTLQDVLVAISEGTLIEPCLDSDETVCITLTVTLPEDVADPDQYENTDETVTFDLRTQQCRHNDDPENPFADVEPCPEPLVCPECTLLGKLETPGNDRLEPNTTYEFDELESEFESGRYVIDVGTVENTTDDENGETVCASFEIRDTETDELLPICESIITGGPPEEGTENGQPNGERRNSISFEPPVFTTGLICTNERENQGGQLIQPAISNVEFFVCI